MNFSLNCEGLGRKTIFVLLPQFETFLSTFHRLVLLIKTINTYIIYIWGYISFISGNVDKKKKLTEAEVAEAEVAETETETEITHLKWTHPKYPCIVLCTLKEIAQLRRLLLSTLFQSLFIFFGFGCVQLIYKYWQYSWCALCCPATVSCFNQRILVLKRWTWQMFVSVSGHSL